MAEMAEEWKAMGLIWQVRYGNQSGQLDALKSENHNSPSARGDFGK